MFGKKKVKIIDLQGTISVNSITGNTVKVNEIIDELFDIYRMKEAVGVILNINSPGGAAGVSNEIAEAVKKIRTAGIPVIATISDICASGAYLIAAQCDWIIANKMSLIGSIGVIMQIPNLKNLSDKIGARYITVQSGKMKDVGNPFREMTADEYNYLSDLCYSSHQIFAEEIINRRPQIAENADLNNIIDGRIFNADDALKYHFIDEIGSYFSAIDWMKSKINDDFTISRKKNHMSIIKEFLNANVNVNMNLLDKYNIFS